MRKGQVSLDLMFAFIAILMLFAGLLVFTGGFQEKTGEATTRNSLKAILIDAYATIGAAKAFGQEITYASPTIKNAGNKNPQNCTITVTQTSITASSVRPDGSTIQEMYSGLGLSDMQINEMNLPASFSCGSTVTIQKVITP